MFANPSKKVPCGDIEMNVRFLVPAAVIYEALTSTQAAQVFAFVCFVISSITHNLLVRLNPGKEVTILSMMAVVKANLSQL